MLPFFFRHLLQVFLLVAGRGTLGGRRVPARAGLGAVAESHLLLGLGHRRCTRRDLPLTALQ